MDLTKNRLFARLFTLEKSDAESVFPPMFNSIAQLLVSAFTLLLQMLNFWCLLLRQPLQGFQLFCRKCWSKCWILLNSNFFSNFLCKKVGRKIAFDVTRQNHFGFGWNPSRQLQYLMRSAKKPLPQNQSVSFLAHNLVIFPDEVDAAAAGKLKTLDRAVLPCRRKRGKELAFAA